MSSATTNGSGDNPPSALQAAQSDLTSVTRVFHRLASVQEAAQLASVLDKLLPRLLTRLGDNAQKRKILAASGSTNNDNAALDGVYGQIQSKITEIMSHILRRVRLDVSVQLPCIDLLQLLVNSETWKVHANVDPFTKNLSLTFLTLGVPRSTDFVTLLPYLLVLRGDAYGLETSEARKSQARQIAHLLLRCFVGIITLTKNNAATTIPNAKALANDNSSNQQTETENLSTARRLCQTEEIAAAVYSLLLDVLLFTTSYNNGNVSSTLPPPGLSAAGNETLRTGASTLAKDWAGEMSLKGNLTQTKMAIIEIIAPSRRVHLLEQANNGSNRTLSLLVIASGDAHRDVADQARLFLKMYLDGVARGGTKATTSTSSTSTSSTSSSPKDSENNNGGESASLGNSLPVALELLQLSLGQSQADAAVPSTTAFSLETVPNPAVGTKQFTQQEILSVKRRPLDSLTAAAALSFVSKVWQDFPDSIDNATPDDIEALAALTDKLARKHLLDPSNLTATHNKAMIATAQLMEGLTRITMQLATDNTQHVGILTEIKDTTSRVLGKVSSMSRSQTSQALDGSLTIRDSCYLVLSHMARSAVFSGILTKNIDTAKLLFSCAAKEEERLQPRAVSALDALLSAYTRFYTVRDKATSPNLVISLPDQSNPWAAAFQAQTDTSSPGDSSAERDSLSRSLLPLLWTACQPHQPKASRVAAARWAQGILLLLDMTKAKACHLLAFLAGDSDMTAASIAREALGLSRNVMDSNFGAASESGNLPDFADFVHLVFDESNRGGQERRVQHYPDFSWQGKAVTLRFGMLCLMTDLYGSDDAAIALYIKTLVETLGLLKKTSGLSPGSALMDLLDVTTGCFATMLGCSTHARMLIAKGTVGFGVTDIEHWIFSATSSRARRYLAEAIGELYSDSSVWGDFSTTAEWLEKTKIGDSLDTCCTEIVQIEKNHFVLGPLHGSLYLGAQLVRAIRLHTVSLDSDFDDDIVWEKLCTVLAMLAKGIPRSDDVVGNASADGIAVALSYPQKDSPVLHPKLSNAMDTILLNISESMKTYKDGEGTDAPRITKLVEAAGVCLAATTSHDSSENNKLGASRMKCLESLMSLLGSGVMRKEEEIGLYVGEALAQYAGCYNIQVQSTVWGEGYDEEFANQLSPHEHALYFLLRKQYRLSNPLHRTASAPALLGIIAMVAREVNRDPRYGERPLVKTVLYALGEIQSVFLGLLSDPKSKHISRESCCLGIAACHGIVKALPVSSSFDETIQSLSVRLMHAFGQTTKHGGSLYQETPEQAAQRRAAERNEASNSSPEPDIMEQFGVGNETGGTANMGEAALGAYREMAEASMALGRPDILYDLLFLSVSHSIWFTGASRERYGASALLGGELNQSKIREALKPQLGKLLPKILRACNDPNKQTREQMSSLLAGLTGGGAETRQAITTHLIDTVDILLKDSSSKLWRARVGACGALSDVIVGRDWSELGGGGPLLEDDFLHEDGGAGAAVRLLRLWRAVFRAIDDVREGVRVNGLSLGRAVRALTLRLCDPSAQVKSSGDKRNREDLLNLARDASAAAATALRWIVKHGLNQRVPESQGLAVSTLVEIISVAKPAILEPSLPDLIRSLLLAVSSLEPAALNYLQLRTRDQEGLERIRLQLAQSGPLAAAVQKCVELLPKAKVETQQSVVVALDAALRLSMGFASRGAVADTASTLSNTCPNAFVFAGLSGTANPSVRLMRAFFYATEKERGQGAKDKMTHALGNIAAFCPGGSVRSLAARAVERYRAATGTQNDPAARRAAAGALRAIVVRATKQLSDGGSSNVWSHMVLPIAFLGQKDEEPKVAALMKEVWDEGGATVLENVSLEFGTRVEEAFLPELVEECVRALDDVSWARRVAGSKSLSELCTLGVLSPLRVTGSDSELLPRDLLVRAKRRSRNCSTAISACARLLKKPRLWKGKSTVVQETVRLISPWTPLANQENVHSMLGLDKGHEVGQCMVLSFGDTVDVIEEDGFFDDTKMEEEGAVEEASSANVEDSSTPETSEESTKNVDFEAMEREAMEATSMPSRDKAPAENLGTLSYTGFCHFLVEEALPQSVSGTLALSEEFLPYRTAALRGFRDLLMALPVTEETIRRLVYQHVENRLVAVVKTGDGLSDDKDASKTPPVLVAASMECIGACLWEQYPRDRAEELASILERCGGKGQPAWTVREAANLALSKLVACAEDSFLRKPSTLSGLIAAASWGAQDRKFWKVRVAALRLVHALVLKSGSSNQRVDSVLEALLPYKEDFQKLLRKALSDTEPRVTSMSSEVIVHMSWWP